MRYLLFFYLCFTLLPRSYGQEQFVLKGVVFSDLNKQRLPYVNIINQRTQVNIKSDEWGVFAITAQIGDTILIQKEGFQEFSKNISAKQNLVVYLKGVIKLEEVVVTQPSKKADQKEVLDDFRSKGVYFNGSPPLLFSIFHPLTAIHELLSKDANNAQRFVNYISRENAESAVDRKFNKWLIMKHIPIKDEDVAEFMFLYRPKPNQVTYWNDYDVIKYIKDSYQKYLKEYKK
jgi:hypothetical protein